VILRNTDSGTVAAAAEGAGLDDAEWNDIARYLDATRSELVFARKVLLVEGFAEQVLVPQLAADAGVDLDAAGISVCAIHGTHFDVYARFLTALGIPWAVLTDGDPAKDDPSKRAGTRRASRILNAIAQPDADDPAEHGIFVGDVTLEQDLYETADNAPVCMAALAELVPRVEADDTLDAAEFMTKVKNRKGRYAQRLAQTDEVLTAPPYVQAAIDYLTEH
jgi:putative ATP-dependent endonuclease of OLD family